MNRILELLTGPFNNQRQLGFGLVATLAIAPVVMAPTCSGTLDEAVWCGLDSSTDEIVLAPDLASCPASGTYYPDEALDADGDGYCVGYSGANSEGSFVIDACMPGLLPGDCDDTDASVWEDCSAAPEDTAPPADTGTPPETDDDGDGWSVEAGDCDDGNSEVSPGATEDSTDANGDGTADGLDGVDNDCDGTIDELECGDGTGLTYWVSTDAEIAFDSFLSAGYSADVDDPSCQSSMLQGAVFVSIWADDGLGVDTVDCEAMCDAFAAEFAADSDLDGIADRYLEYSDATTASAMVELFGATVVPVDSSGDGVYDSSICQFGFLSP